MKFRLLLFSFIFGVVLSYSQNISNVNFDEIKLKIKDSTSSTYYPKLIKRFIEFDKTLTNDDYKLIYYGNVYQSYYSPYGDSDNQDKFMELYKSEKYTEAIPLGEKVIQENAVNPKILFKLLVCHYTTGDTVTAKKYAKLYWGLLNRIYESGDGNGINSAYVVISVDDEYEILADLSLSMTKQALVGVTDVLTISKKGQKPPKGQKKITKLYFNVSKPFGHLGDMLKGSNN